MYMFWQMMRREFNIHMQRKSEWLSVLLFYVMIISLFPIAIGPIPQNLLWTTPVIIWSAVLLAMLLAQESLLRTDFDLGIFDQILISGHSLSHLVFAKILAHWVIYALPLVLFTPFLGLSLSVPIQNNIWICVSIILGTLTLSFVGALGAALTLILNRSGVLLAILILPLYVPVLSLGSSFGMLNLQGFISNGHIAILSALAIISVCTLPVCVAKTIKVSME